MKTNKMLCGNLAEPKLLMEAEMTSSLSPSDVAELAEQVEPVQQTECTESPTKKHEWLEHGLWPATWQSCKHCHTKNDSK